LTRKRIVYLIINKYLITQTIKIKVMSKTNTKTVSLKRGRPTVEGSKRQAVLAMRAAKVAAGGTIQRGRPKNPVTIQVDVVAKTRTIKSKAPKAEVAADEAI
jgi:hypothetical protein